MDNFLKNGLIVSKQKNKVTCPGGEETDFLR